MVICDRPIADVVPTEWARMENRSVVQWDKDDCAAVGLVKFDLLGLGMLEAIHHAVDQVEKHRGRRVELWRLGLWRLRCTPCWPKLMPSECSKWNPAHR